MKMSSNKENYDNLLFSSYDINFKLPYLRKDIISLLDSIRNNQSDILDIQSLRFDSLLSKDHLHSAVWHAWKAIINEHAISNRISVEFMLYLSGNRQISKALSHFGLSESEKSISVVFFHKNVSSFEIVSEILGKKFDIESLSDIHFSRSTKKLEKLAHIFDFDFNSNYDDQSVYDFEKYLMSCIANLVFEN